VIHNFGRLLQEMKSTLRNMERKVGTSMADIHLPKAEAKVDNILNALRAHTERCRKTKKDPHQAPTSSAQHSSDNSNVEGPRQRRNSSPTPSSRGSMLSSRSLQAPELAGEEAKKRKRQNGAGENQQTNSAKRLHVLPSANGSTLILCKECNKNPKGYPSKKRLADHVRYCHPKMPEKKLLCTQCNKNPGGYLTKGKLHDHVRYCHSEMPEKKFPCTQCNKNPGGYLTKRKLDEHVRNCHHKMPEKKFPCTQCDKNPEGYSSKKKLADHVRHCHHKMPEKKLLCTQCDKNPQGYSSQSKLNEHISLFHPKGLKEIPEFSCTQWDSRPQGFPNQEKLDEHVQLHHTDNFPVWTRIDNPANDSVWPAKSFADCDTGQIQALNDSIYQTWKYNWTSNQ